MTEKESNVVADQVENTTDAPVVQEQPNVAEGSPEPDMQAEYMRYVNSIKESRLTADSRVEIVDSINTICQVLKLTTVIPKVETRASKGPDGKAVQQQVIVGGTPIDLIKSQYPGIYPILMERLCELTVKL